MARATGPLLIFVITPGWGDSYYHKLTMGSPFLRYHKVLPKAGHQCVSCQWRALEADAAIDVPCRHLPVAI